MHTTEDEQILHVKEESDPKDEVKQELRSTRSKKLYIKS